MNQTRNTKQRQLVRDLLCDNYDHPTADEVYDLARRQSPSISRGTVYRNLNLLAESGEISRVKMPIGPDRYDCVTSRHYHFLCRACQCVLDTGIPYQKDLPSALAGLPGCTIENHSLLLMGLCPHCSTETIKPNNQ